jgi:membrane-bound serine protease (ClpP class)
MYASHIAAMAPGTNLGAATPVQMAMNPPGDAAENDKREKKVQPKTGDEKPAAPGNQQAMRQKVVNDAVAYIRGLAELHGRNQAWAEKAVREGASLQASEALKLKVIDIVASGTAELLQKIDGRAVTVQGQKRVLRTAGLPVGEYNPDWRTRLLSVITNPNVAYILLMIGIYGLIFEFSNPGAIIPGTVGAICLLLALYSLQLLPINYAGVGLLLLGIGLMVAEAFEPSFGILGIGGVIAFLFGSIILMETDVPGFGIDLSVIITFTVLSALMFIFIVGMAIRARRRPVVSGMEQLLDAEGVAMEAFDIKGPVMVHSEIWQATTTQPLQKGQAVRVTGRKGLVLQVEAIRP